jgi:hypothetical protein
MGNPNMPRDASGNAIINAPTGSTSNPGTGSSK